MPAWTVLPAAPIIGSWLGVLVRRLPQHRPVALARSACDHCGHRLGPAELVPLASFIMLRGRCRQCRTPMGWFYPAIELAALAIAAAAYDADYGIGGDTLRIWIDAGLGWTLLCAAWIDAETYRLPDVITLPLTLAGLAVTWLDQPAAIYNHAAAAALGYMSFRLLDKLYLAIRHRQGLGAGDAKLLAAAGAWLGLAALPDVVLGGGLIGIATALFMQRHGKLQRHQPIAFGPALALSFFLIRLFVN